MADVEGFGERRRTEPHQRAVRDGLYEVMKAAFTAAKTVWQDCYREDRGDAVFLLVPGEVDKAAFIEAILPMVVTRLRVHNDTHPEAQRIRLRIALHAGEVGYDEHGVTSSSLTLAFRLCDAPPLKAALASSPGLLAVIASDWLFDDVVRHTPGAAPASWRPVPVEVKEIATTGWITLPDHPYPAGGLDPAPPDTRTEHAGRPRSGRVVPRQLPGSVRDFTGRADHLAALDALIPPDPGQHDGRPQSVVITAVDGAGGMGKTTLALHWAHRIQHRFPDGTLHINLRGYGPGVPVTAGEALSGLLRALGVAARAIPADVDAQAALLRSLLSGKRALLLLDNAHSAEQIRPLLPGTAGCMAVVTSRDSLTGLVVTDAAHRLTLDLLSEAEALDLVSGILGADRAAAEPDAVGELVQFCGRLPLALRVAASRAAAHPHLTVADVVTELADDRTRLDVLSEFGDERAAVRAVFDWSYGRLPSAQARLFRRLGLHPGPDLSLAAAAALAELPPAETRPLLAALANAHLIEPAAGGRYRFHDLLRAYAADQARGHDTDEDRYRALESMLTFYVHTVGTADRFFYRLFPQMLMAVAEPAHPHPIGDIDEAWVWVTAERANILAVLQYVDKHQLDHYIIPLARACRFLGSTGNPSEQIYAYGAGIAALSRAGNHTQESILLLGRGELSCVLGQWTEAREDLDRATTLAQEMENIEIQAYCLNAQGLLLIQQGRFEQAAQWLNRALPLSRGLDAGRLEAVLEGNLCIAHLGLGNSQLALEHAEHGLRLRRQARDPGEALALLHLARARRQLGDPEAAIKLCRESMALGYKGRLDRHDAVAEPLDVLATCLHQIGRTSEAITYWQKAAIIYDESGYLSKAAEVRQRLTDAQTPP
ncbi:ATP-binding protein [Amycolatopsis umgeniensis]|uniref:Tetratricopeptide (TPR) repeat protein n=1 Tax=Amycolatopsis umgeniensis TaxID=336628 RepID=A0A841BDS9_9PSEU|nr:tetratricopeptide repeat protein [Amycolatopsis umgeniensis]MBB5858146.1 tetratricopeptide (TPR) repeat protein [Amycolatopsis umgeniensis]